MSVGTIQPVHSYPLSVKQYHRMIQAGILTEDDPVELLEGYLVAKMPKGPPHDATLTILAGLLMRMLPREDWGIRVQCAVTLSKSEPEPDLAIVAGPEEKYLSRHPLAGDIGLVIEVADSSLERDRTLKGRAYARANLAEYWIVNLVDQVVEVYTKPKGGKQPGYEAVQNFTRRQKIPVTIDGTSFGELAVKRILRDPS